MKPTKVLQEIRKMRFEEAYEGWNTGRLTQAEAARILGVCERSFRHSIVDPSGKAQSQFQVLIQFLENSTASYYP